jgi:Putative zinc-finger
MSPDTPPPPDRRLLAAYADGELSDDARARIDAALAGRPAEADELRAQQEFARSNREFWNAAAPPEPTEAAWGRTLERIEAALCKTAPPPPRPGFLRRHAAVVGFLAAGAAAALVWLVAGLDPPAVPKGPSSPVAAVGDADDGEVLAVARADDVEIMSIREDDVAMLVVGRHPLPGPIPLAGLDDVVVHSMAPDADGQWPEAHMGSDNSDVPMIYVPLARAP